MWVGGGAEVGGGGVDLLTGIRWALLGSGGRDAYSTGMGWVLPVWCGVA